MTQPIGGAATQGFDWQRMQKIVDLVEDRPTETSPFKSADVAQIGGQSADAGDVIVMKPMPMGDIAQAALPAQTAEITRELESRGIAVEDKLDMVGGVTTHVGDDEAKKLKEEGYLVFDNSRRSLVPGFPGKSLALDSIEMPKIDPVAMTHAGAIQQAGFTGKGQVVAVIDSGFDHPGTKLKGYKDFVDGDSTPSDPVGHGTHVAGDVLQLAPDAGIVSVRVMNAEGQGRPSDIIRGIQWTIQNKEQYGITTINMSLGGAPDGEPDTLDPVNRAVEQALKKGITVVAAAGNSGPEPHSIGSPGDDAHDITVGSGLNPTTVSDFSSRGPTDDGLHKPDVMAPGEFIVSWSVPNSQMDQMGQVVDKLRHMSDDQLVKLLKAKPQLIEALKLPPDIMQMSSQDRLEALHKALPPIFKPSPDTIAAPGTSFASPIVAGIVADVKQADPSMPPQRVKDILTGTADDMGRQYGPDDEGAGFVNAEKAIAAANKQRG